MRCVCIKCGNNTTMTFHICSSLRLIPLNFTDDWKSDHLKKLGQIMHSFDALILLTSVLSGNISSTIVEHLKCYLSVVVS